MSASASAPTMSDCGLSIAAASATVQDATTVLILFELVSTDGHRISDYRELQALVYDAAGRVWGRAYTNWSEFGRRQSDEIEVQNERAREAPARVKLFPAIR